MPTVLVLYPGAVSFRQEQMARHKPMLAELGIRMVLADDFPQDSDRAFFDEIVALPPCDRVVEGWRVLESWLAAHEVDGVLAQSEPAILLGSLAAAKIGRPGIRPHPALLCVSKYLCRLALERARVPQPRFVLARDAVDVRAFAREAGYPVVLKATASALGRLVTLLESPSQIDAAVNRMLAGLSTSTDVRRLAEYGRAAGIELGYDPSREFLVESFAAGDPLETDGILVGAEARTFGVTEQILTKPPLFFVEAYLLPADRPEREIEEIERVSDAALAALGVADTGYSVEMRVHAALPVVIEVNGRLGWDEGFGDLFEIVTGFQPAFLCLQLALGVRPAFDRKKDVRCALAYQSTYVDGKILSLPTPGEIAEVERGGVRAGLAVHLGERTYAPPHPDATPHLAWALSTHPSSSRLASLRARESVDQLRFGIEIASAADPR